jgi:diphthamide synthase (EF-2-diphthine--ammonia ligase)
LWTWYWEEYLEGHRLNVFVNKVLRIILGRTWIEAICEQGSEKNIDWMYLWRRFWELYLEERRLKVLVNAVLRKILRLKKEELGRSWRQRNIEELHNLHTTLRVNKWFALTGLEVCVLRRH